MLSRTRTTTKALISALVITVSAVSAVSLSGCGSGNGTNIQIPGVTGPTAAMVNNVFTLSMVIQNVSLSGGLTIPIPNMPNSYLEVGPDLQSNGLLISVGMDVRDIAAIAHGNVALLDPQTLPGGRALPGIASGTVPAIAVEVPKWDHMVFYVGPSVFGLFVPVNLGMQGYIGTFRFYDTHGLNVGNISIVGSDANNQNAGVLLMIPISGAVGTIVNAAG